MMGRKVYALHLACVSFEHAVAMAGPGDTMRMLAKVDAQGGIPLAINGVTVDGRQADVTVFRHVPEAGGVHTMQGRFRDVGNDRQHSAVSIILTLSEENFGAVKAQASRGIVPTELELIIDSGDYVIGADETVSSFNILTSGDRTDVLDFTFHYWQASAQHGFEQAYNAATGVAPN